MRGLLQTFLVVGILTQVSALQAAVAPSAPVKWQTNLKQAAAEAQRSGKPILVQMTAPWCGYCHKMLRETFTDPAVAKRVNEFFVPLLLDADANPQAVEILAVDSFPSTIVISAQFEELGRLSGFLSPVDFTKKITPFCKAPQPLGKPSNIATPATKTTTAAKAPTAIKPVSRPEFEAPQELKQPDPIALGASKALRLPDQKVKEPTPELKQTAATIRPKFEADDEPIVAPTKLGFNGMCLVSMQHGREVVDGNAQFVHTYKGLRLQFASAENLAEFKAAPDRFWPMFDGRCPVALTHDEEKVAGDPEAAGLYQGHLVFFIDEAHRDEFIKTPRHFVREASEK